jgi:hypothetical protein
MDIGLAPGLDDLVTTRINRTADWIMVVWREDSGGVDVFGRAIQTRGPGDGPRTLANSTSPLVTFPNQTSFDIDVLTVQSEIADGTGDPFCGVQSNRNRINFTFQQQNMTDTSIQRLIHNGIVFTADATGSAPPVAVAALTGATDGLVDEHDTDYALLGSDMRPVVADLGVASGAPLVYYLRNDNNPTDASAPGAFTEIRVFGKPGIPTGIATVIGTDAPPVDNTINDPMWDSGEDPIDELTNGIPGTSRFPGSRRRRSTATSSDRRTSAERARTCSSRRPGAAATRSGRLRRVPSRRPRSRRPRPPGSAPLTCLPRRRRRRSPSTATTRRHPGCIRRSRTTTRTSG